MLIWPIAAAVFIGCCLTLKFAARPVALAYGIGRRIGEVRAIRRARRERHRNCLAEGDVTQLIRALADAVRVLEAHGTVPVDVPRRPDLRLVPYYDRPGSAPISWN